LVDIPEQLARILREYVAGKTGYLFATRTGKPLLQRNVHRALYNAGARCGFHAFRRYRTAVLRRVRVPEDLIGMWLGHARNLTDWYAAQLKDDTAFRSEWCERAGLGFQLGYVGLQNEVTTDEVEVA
jgi:integrase